LLEDAFPGGAVTHLDISNEAVCAVRARLAQRLPPPSARAVVCGDARALPFPADSFDLVVRLVFAASWGVS
jgi:ubiquinone/menaquinone biosynthesis C-methylase UbiE